ncbi:MAG: crotonobetainyl-CoA:carnitine CoA-transferase CaiB-like acyl-CoA transferase [Gammaproteobacteria bacterium]|jgi:crotonobetainyl-CoA:carnitine CoA-transferase CaiB-like acyl-CoA transferase
MSTDKAMNGPLHGIRIIDLTTILLGPFATQILGDMGADVIKVESPAGDSIRDVGPTPTQRMGSVFFGANRNKRGLVLDLKAPAGLQAMRELVRSADVFVHNMRPQAVQRLGLDYQALQAINPRIIFCGAYGFRQSGPYASKPAYDDIIQAASGMAHLQGAGAAPQYVTSSICDKITAQAVAHAVTLALFHRERHGEGQSVAVTMFENMTAFNMLEHLYGQTYIPPRTLTGYTRTLSKHRRPFRTLDGYIGVLPYSDRQWQAVFEAAERTEFMDDERFKDLHSRHQNIDALYVILAQLLSVRTTAAWLDDLDAGNVPAMAVLSGEDLIADEHLAAIGFWEEREIEHIGTVRMPGIPMQFSASPGAIRRTPPRLGEHSVEVLRECGLGDIEIQQLVEQGITIDGSSAASITTE